MILFLVGSLIICFQGFTIKEATFEAISALSTAGLITSITRSLPALSRVTIMVLMYAGRVGTLSFALAVAERKMKANVKKATENIIVN